MSAVSTYCENWSSLGIDEKLMAITIFYNKEHEVKFSDLFIQSTSMEQRINKMVLSLIETIIYQAEQELRRRGYLKGILEITQFMKQLAQSVFQYAKTNYIFKRFILDFFNNGKTVHKFTNQDLIIFYNAVLQEGDSVFPQEGLGLQYHPDYSEIENINIEIEAQVKTQSLKSVEQQQLVMKYEETLSLQNYGSQDMRKDFQQNNEISDEQKFGTSEGETQTMSLIEIEKGWSKESQQFIELFTRQMRVPSKYQNAKVVQTKTLTVLKRGQPHYTCQYYDSLEGGKVRIIMIGPS